MRTTFRFRDLIVMHGPTVLPLPQRGYRRACAGSITGTNTQSYAESVTNRELNQTISDWLVLHHFPEWERRQRAEAMEH